MKGRHEANRELERSAWRTGGRGFLSMLDGMLANGDDAGISAACARLPEHERTAFDSVVLAHAGRIRTRRDTIGRLFAIPVSFRSGETPAPDADGFCSMLLSNAMFPGLRHVCVARCWFDIGFLIGMPPSGLRNLAVEIGLSKTTFPPRFPMSFRRRTTQAAIVGMLHGSEDSPMVDVDFVPDAVQAAKLSVDVLCLMPGIVDAGTLGDPKDLDGIQWIVGNRNPRGEIMDFAAHARKAGGVSCSLRRQVDGRRTTVSISDRAGRVVESMVFDAASCRISPYEIGRVLAESFECAAAAPEPENPSWLSGNAADRLPVRRKPSLRLLDGRGSDTSRKTTERKDAAPHDPAGPKKLSPTC